MRNAVRVAGVVMVVGVVGAAHARPPRLTSGEQPRIEHIVEGAPEWLAACPITLVQADPDTFAVGASCGAFETLMFERKRIDAKEFEERVRDEAQEAGAALVAITIPTALGPATGYAFVLPDRHGPAGTNTYVMVRRAGAKNAPNDLLTCTSGAKGDQLARCKTALEAVGRSSIVKNGRGGFPRAAGERAGT
ncbi:MAG: hypothetical protein H0T46_21795 [Deltaproteobacteria bacterium]|nr:hypothetical protein [Deltaproteobacteria bacterium]